MARCPSTIAAPSHPLVAAVLIAAASAAMGAGLCLVVDSVTVAGGALATAVLAVAAPVVTSLGHRRGSQGGAHSGDGWDTCAACARLADGPKALAQVLARDDAAKVRVAVVGLVRFSSPHGLRREPQCELLSRLAPVDARGRLYRLPGDRLALLSAKPEPELRSALHALLSGANKATTGAMVAAAVDGGGGQLREAFERADAALRAAAGHGRSLVTQGEPAPAPLTQERADAVRRLVTGTSAVAVAYQPVVELLTGRVLGYEALMRPRAGHLGSPTEAFALAGRLGLAAALDRVCREAVLSDAPGLDMRSGELLFVNVAGQAFVEEVLDLTDLVAAVRDAGLAPRRVVLEVADEPGVDPPALARRLAAAHAAGFRLGLDDVGGPGSRIDTVRLCRFDFLKIDESLTVAAAHDRQSRAVFRSLCTLANQLGCTLVVEGVETEALLHSVHEVVGHRLDPLAVGAAQGYHLGRPAPRPRRQPTPGASEPSASAS